MADIIQSKKVIKGSAKLYFKTPLLLKSGYSDIFSDSTIEKTFDGENIHINGYVWSSLMRRCIGRLKNGSAIAEKIGKYKENNDEKTPIGVSSLWCETSFIPVNGLYIRPGNAIDRKYGAVKEGALFNDEIAPQGLKLNLNFNYFLTDENEDEIKKLLIDALWVLNSGIENIGGGWSYGLGRLGLKEACIKILDLSYEQDRIALWRFDDEALKDGESIQPEDIKQPEIEKPWTIITADASIAKGQLLAVSSSYPAFDEKESYPEYPDSFVYRGYVVDDLGQIKTEPIIPGRTIRQAILSTQIERKLRTINTDTICTSLAGVCNCDPCIAFRKKNKTGDSPDCKCLKCNWFGSGGKGGIIAVTDAVVQGAVSEVVHRIQLCEHSMQNINLFSEEYLTKGTFKIRLIIDESRNNSHTERLKKEVLWVLNDMREDGISPPGWYRIGATSTATGQVVIKGEPKVKHCGGIDD